MTTSLIAPYLSEKSAQHMSAGLYVFTVSREATKATVRQELKKAYNVDAIAVRIVNLPAQKVRFKSHTGIRSARRKAYIQLKPKQVIAGFESLLEKDKKEAQAEKSTQKTKEKA